MPQRRTRSYYPAATWSVILVGLVALAGAALRKYIPRPPLNAMQRETDPYLVAGATQPIQWRTLSQETFAEARREDKLIFLLIGQASSLTGQLLDRYGLTDSETADTIRRNFVPVRVDAIAHPYLAAAYDPVRRPMDGWDPACQIWYLDSNGLSYGSLLPISTNPSVMQSSLSSSIAYYMDVKARTKDIPAGRSQRGQIKDLVEASFEEPNFKGQLQALLQSRDPGSGAWPAKYGTRLQATPLLFLLEHAPVEAAFSLERLATSGMVDWVNGGFFSCARQPALMNPDFEKSAVTNAALAEVFSRAGDNELYREIAQEACKELTTDFMHDGWVVANRYGDEAANRSRRSSFSPRFLVDHVDGITRDRGVDLLRLDPRKNPAMLPKVTSSDSFRDNKGQLLAVLDTLRESKTDVEQRFTNQVTASIHGYVTARLLTCARLLGDPALAKKANELFEKLQNLRTGENDVLRDPKGDVEPACLADYLAYSDAALQATLLIGNEDIAKDGLRVLRRAIEFFSLAPGVLSYASPECVDILPPNTIVPQVVDGEMESTSAMAIRLAIQYAWLCESLLGANADDLRAFARTSTDRFAKTANSIQIGYTGYFRAALMAKSDRYIVVRGRDVKSMSQEVLRQLPLQFVLAIPTKDQTKLTVVIGKKAIEFPSVDALSAVFQVR